MVSNEISSDCELPELRINILAKFDSSYSTKERDIFEKGMIT